MPLGYHLRAYKNVGLVVSEGLEYPLVRAFSACSIRVHAQNPSSSEVPLDFFYYFFCAGAEMPYACAAAIWATIRDLPGPVAVMALHAVL